MSDPFIGEIRILGFSWAPYKWAHCNGQLMPVNQNAALYSLLGTNYGGDGINTFGIPNLQSRVPMHYGHGPGLSVRPFASVWGFETTTLQTANLPQAAPLSATTTITGDVKVKVTDSPGNVPLAAGNGLAKRAMETSGGQTLEVYDNAAAYTQNNQLGGVTHNLAATTQVSGGLSGGTSYPINNMQPYLALNFCIALDGTYPSRN